MPTPPSNPRPINPKRRRRVRQILIGAGLVGAWYLATQSVVTTWIANLVLSASVGAPVVVHSARLDLTGRIVAKGMSVLAPGLSGPEAEVLHCRRVEAEVNWAGVLWGAPGPVVHDVIIDDLVLRFSQSTDGQEINIPRFQSGATSGIPALPSVTVRGGVLELGEHVRTRGAAALDQPRYTMLKRIDVTGAFAPGEEPNSYVWRLSQIGGPLTVEGRLSEKAVRVAIDGVTLDDFPLDSLPLETRELFRRLDLSGTLRRTSFSYEFPKEGASASAALQGVVASVEVANVAVTLPFEDLASRSRAGVVDATGARRYPRMTNVAGQFRFLTGELEADLAGTLEDLPYRVELRWHGPRADAAFEATVSTPDFDLREHPGLGPFFPPIVHERLEMFGNPTARVNSSVIVTRGAPRGETPAPVEVKGRIDFDKGIASFIRFPYEFRDLRGHLEFDDNAVTITSISGKAVNGATLVAKGHISPLTDEAAVDVEVLCENVPVDEMLENGLGERRRAVIGKLFNKDRFAELKGKGLILSPRDADVREEERRAADRRVNELIARIASGEKGLDRELAASQEDARRALVRTHRPVFELGGLGRVHLDLSTPFGRDMPWIEDIKIEIPRAGMLPERFPLPIVAENVRLRVYDSELTMSEGSFHAVRGGEARVIAKADFSSKGAGKGTDVRVSAQGVPLDDLLLNAVPGGAAPLSPVPGSPSLKEAIADMQLSGDADAEIWIGDRPDSDTTFSAFVSFDGLSATPAAGARTREPWNVRTDLTDGLHLADLSGTVIVQDSGVSLDLLGSALSIGPDLIPTTAADLDLHAQADLAPGGKASGYRVELTAGDLDPQTPIERLVEAFSPKAGRTVANLRAQYQPQGQAELHAVMTDRSDTPVSIEIAVPRTLSFVYPFKHVAPERLELTHASGTAVVRAGEDVSVECLNLSGPIAARNEPAGVLTLNGAISFDRDDPAGGTLDVAVRHGDFSSALTRLFVRDRMGERTAAFFDEHSITGSVDAEFALSPVKSNDQFGWDVAAVVRPRTLDLLMPAGLVDFPQISGEIRGHGTQGTINGLSLAAIDWAGTAGGTWTITPDGGAVIDLNLACHGQGLPDGLRALLPDSLQDLLSDTKLAVGGGFDVPQLSLTLGLGGDESQGMSTRSSGLLRFSDVSGDFGVRLREAFGSVRFNADTAPDRKPTFDVTALLDTVRAADVRLTDVSAVALSGEHEGDVLVPQIVGDCHGGKLTAEVSLTPGTRDPDGTIPSRFQSRVDFSGVLLSPLLTDLGSTTQGGKDDDSARLDGNFAIAGVAGDTASRRGRGSLTIGGGTILAMPVLLPLIQVSNLQIPGSAALDTGKASFFLQGPVLMVERASFFASGVEIRGYGTVTWPDLALDLVFNSRSTVRVPLLTSIVERVRDQLVTTAVRGTAKKPEISVVPFRSVSGWLFDGVGPDEQRRMRDLERAAPEDAARGRVTVPTRSSDPREKEPPDAAARRTPPPGP